MITLVIVERAYILVKLIKSLIILNHEHSRTKIKIIGTAYYSG